VRPPVPTHVFVFLPLSPQPVQLDLWMRYTLTAALDKVLVAAEREKSGHLSAETAAVAIPMDHPPVDGGEGGAGASGMSCPVVGAGASGGGQQQQQLQGAPLSPQLYGAMDVDERTAIVHKHLPPGLLVFVEAALQVRRGRGVSRQPARVQS
jgi:hypothetical protein